MTTEKVKYGVHSEAGKLRKVMVCSPGLAHQRLTPNNCDELLFDDVLWVAQAKRDHFDFVTKMRERNIDVLEMHNLLTDIVAIPEALDWILERKITANSVGLGLINETASWLRSLEPRQIAEFLIGGVSADDLPTVSVARPSRCSATSSATPASSCRRCPTPSSPATPPAGSTVA